MVKTMTEEPKKVRHSISAASSILDQSETTTRRRIKSGVLEAHRDGGCIYILAESIDAYVKRLPDAKEALK